MQPMNPKIIFEDQHLIIVDKPAGLLSQGESTGDNNLVSWMRHYLGRHYVGLIHRLDRNTSGLMVVAKRSKAARRLTDALQHGTLKRTYQAWLIGKLPHTTEWQHQLLKDEAQNLVKVVTSGGKTALLTVTPEKSLRWRGHDLTLAHFELSTGRSHQIRVQSAYEGFPLLGDHKYGTPGAPSFPRLALHSASLSFPHPMTEELMSYKIALPSDLQLSSS